jgi:ABC-type transport system involved in multi-copper enzyme maturation permease subunit
MSTPPPSPRSRRVLVWYSLALAAAGIALLAKAPSASAWAVYGFGCLALALICLIMAGQRTLAARYDAGKPGLLELLAAPVHRAQAAGRSTVRALTPRPRSVPAVGIGTARPGLPGMGITQRRVILSEWTKFHSLRSTKVVLLVAAVVTVGMAAIIGAVVAAQWDGLDPISRAKFNPATDPLQGVALSQLAVGVLGVLLITGEYATGMIRSSLTVVPRRLAMLWGKLAVFAAVVGGACLASTLVAFYIGQALLSRKELNVGITAPHALRGILGAAIYLVIIGVIGLGFGTLLRNTAAAISSLVALLFVVPIVLNFFPRSVSHYVAPYLPDSAGAAFWAHSDTWHVASPVAAFLVLCAWAGGLTAAATWRLLRDDA